MTMTFTIASTFSCCMMYDIGMSIRCVYLFNLYISNV